MSQSALDTAAEVRTSRVLAFLIDFSLLSTITAVIWGVFFVVRLVVGVGGMAASSMDSSAAMAGTSILGYVLGLVMWFAIGAVLVGYFVYFLTNGGQTLGMKFLDVSVVSEDGSSVVRNNAFVRTAILLAPLPLMALVSVFVPFLGFPIALAMMVGWLLVEAVVMFVSDDGQRIGDRIANTYVVDAGA